MAVRSAVRNEAKIRISENTMPRVRRIQDIRLRVSAPPL